MAAGLRRNRAVVSGPGGLSRQMDVATNEEEIGVTITNAHVHLIELQKMIELQGDVQIPASISVLKEMETTLPLLSPMEAIRQMDEAGIDRSVLYAVEAPIVYASNEYVAGLCQAFPDRFIGFASVHPLDPQAPDKLEAAVKNLGLKGLKLHPPLQGFSPNDERVFPTYEKALELNIPIVFHVGSTPFGCLCRLDHASPILLDQVAVRYPQLRIMLTHLGTLWHNESFMVVEKNPNVYIDTAAYVTEIAAILTPDIITRIGPDKIIFGTDYPMPYAGKVHKMKEFVDVIRSIDVSDQILADIFHNNFERMLAGNTAAEQVISASDMLAQLGQMMPAQ